MSPIITPAPQSSDDLIKLLRKLHPNTDADFLVREPYLKLRATYAHLLEREGHACDTELTRDLDQHMLRSAAYADVLEDLSSFPDLTPCVLKGPTLASFWPHGVPRSSIDLDLAFESVAQVFQAAAHLVQRDWVLSSLALVKSGRRVHVHLAVTSQASDMGRELEIELTDLVLHGSPLYRETSLAAFPESLRWAMPFMSLLEESQERDFHLRDVLDVHNFVIAHAQMNWADVADAVSAAGMSSAAATLSSLLARSGLPPIPLPGLRKHRPSLGCLLRAPLRQIQQLLYKDTHTVWDRLLLICFGALPVRLVSALGLRLFAMPVGEASVRMSFGEMSWRAQKVETPIGTFLIRHTNVFPKSLCGPEEVEHG